MERWLVLVGAGVLLVALGVAIPFASFQREVSAEYTVDVTAPADLTWVLWLPMPLSPMDVQPRGQDVSLQVINPGRGLFYNMTGSGSASLSGSSHHFVFDLYPLEWQGERVDLSGSETGGGFWVYRATDDASATIRVTGGAHWSASYLGGSIACGGPGFQGEPSEGWTLLGQPAGDCVEMLDGFPWLVAGAVAGNLGVAFLVLAAVVHYRQGCQGGGQVFLPPPA